MYNAEEMNSGIATANYEENASALMISGQRQCGRKNIFRG
jgi:hypothetical protein